MSIEQRRAAAVLLACFAAGPTAAPARADRVIADADAVRPPLGRGNVTVRVGRSDDAAEPDRCYHISVNRAAGQTRGAVLFHLSEGLDPSKYSGVAVRLRAVAGPGGNTLPVRVRLLGFDAGTRIVLQRRLDLEPGEAARDVSLPWTHWRWGEFRAGGPAELRRIGLRLEEPAPGQQVELDDLRFTDYPQGADPAAAGADWLRRLAFGNRDVRMAQADGLLVATDATEELTDADLAQILARMRRVRALVRRLFGDAVRPIQGPHPPALLIFRQRAEYRALCPRLGEAWGDPMPPPVTSGLTFQNISALPFDRRYGADRGLYTHETAHAVLANDVRLGNVSQRYDWLHEGVATYVQWLVHPRPPTRTPLPAAFARPIPPDGSGYFKPLESLMTGIVPRQSFMQLATVVAYLVEEKPDWLPVIARELVAGRTTPQALAACGTSVAELEKAWMAWGKEKFPLRQADNGAEAGKPPFAIPPELREHAREDAARDGSGPR